MKTKKAISLIVLVITIIVMIILASAVIITLSNTGIIGKAQEAVDKTNMAQIKEDAEMIKWDLKLTNSKLTQAELVTKLNEHFEQSTVAGNVITTGKYDITVGEDLTITVGKHQGTTVPEDPETPIYFGDIYVADVEMTMDGKNINKMGIVVYENSAAEMYYAIEGFGDTLFCVNAFEGAVIEDDKITLAEEEATIVDKETVSLNFGDDTIIFTHSDQEVHGIYRGYTYTGGMNDYDADGSLVGTINVAISLSTNNTVTAVSDGVPLAQIPVNVNYGDHYFYVYDTSTGEYIPIAFISADGRSVLYGGAILLTLDETTAPEETIWEAYDIYDAVANVSDDIMNEFSLNKNYHIETYIKVESIYKQYTLQEYKEQYIVNAMLETSTMNVSLDDILILRLSGNYDTTIDAVLEQLEQAGTEYSRDELVYGWLFNEQDVDDVLESMGYNVSDIEAEYNSFQQVQIPTQIANKTYTITYPDNTTKTILGTELSSFVGRYKIVENGTYNIKISDDETEENKKVSVSKIVPETYEDDYYTYTFIAPSENSSEACGYDVVVKDKTLSSYGEILTSIAGAPIISLENTYSGCTSLTTSPTVPDTVLYMVGTYAGCTSLTTVSNFPTSLISMNAAFEGCTNLTTVPNIPNSVTEMYRTFEDCTNLTTIPNFPTSLTVLRQTFWGCTNLTTVPNLPTSVTNMYGTFYDCINLTTVPSIPENVTDLNRAFANCSKLGGVMRINCTGDVDASGALFDCAEESGSLTVVIPNDTVREFVINYSSYDPSKITIVKSL